MTAIQAAGAGKPKAGMRLRTGADYLVSLRERLLNPYLAHRLADIAQNHAQKKQRRLAPIVALARQLGLHLAQPRLNAALANPN